jgi:HD superfamily phosphohydrolase
MSIVQKKKIINDPVYGFVSIPSGLIYDLIEQAWFQRLRRIRQLGLTHYVYPGAQHTRFQHVIGAVHLTQQAIEILRSKGIEISEQEKEAVCAAVLLHDMGHGPYSHTLEYILVKDVSHESISIHYMNLFLILKLISF